ncbi:MAG: tRNA uridine-5-carboxymethylaminomethyl(34) synthesis GTPase MnmE [Pseudoflavonifractor sp.]|nr:tRNA uridine-5-carboxymethylaminomethyl(34) synthesis GTPase MnmE [Alloprevotella sp.]MCM1117497.1 tRNA uridine-5-carboxymethylaminomethyl(34) synthesis GTPase MnmE [Pseudoflavonifractor sp.]
MSTDTICAISTPPGTGGIAVVRISGPDTFTIVNAIWKGRPLVATNTHTAHLGTIIDTQASAPLDQCVATIFTAPHSYTGDDTIELSVHGSIYIQQRLLDILISQGARMAEPGEFTRRAFAAGNIDLSQAEAVADLIAADSRAAHSLAMSQFKGTFSSHINDIRQSILKALSLIELEIDFSEENIQFASRDDLRQLITQSQVSIQHLIDTFKAGQAIKDGIPIAIIGNTNAGKSTLLNRLLSHERAIVSDIHGTTRDTIEETIYLDRYKLRLIDTAGIRPTVDPIEQIGIDRSLNALSRCRLAILLIDPSQPLDNPLLVHVRQLTQLRPDNPAPLIIAINKADIYPKDAAAHPIADQAITISAHTGQGIDHLKQAIITAIGETQSISQGDIILTNRRHHTALTEANSALTDTLEAIDHLLTPDLIALHLRQAASNLATITGAITNHDILGSIFSTFCIGK